MGVFRRNSDISDYSSSDDTEYVGSENEPLLGNTKSRCGCSWGSISRAFDCFRGRCSGNTNRRRLAPISDTRPNINSDAVLRRLAAIPIDLSMMKTQQTVTQPPQPQEICEPAV